jgi:hypothetical protein
MELKSIQTKTDVAIYGRNLIKQFKRNINLERLYLQELSELKSQMSQISSMSDYRANLIRHVHWLLLTNAIVNKVASPSIDSYIKLFKI